MQTLLIFVEPNLVTIISVTKVHWNGEEIGTLIILRPFKV